jgi:hypothetical protein
VLASEMVTAVKREGGFDTQGANIDDATILSWLNEAYRRLVGESKWRKATRELGPTVAGEGQYALGDDVTDVAALQVAGSGPWLRVSQTDLWEITVGTRSFSGAGVFAPDYQADGTAVVELYPPPSTAGLPISALAAVLPSALTTSPDTSPAVPADLHQSIVDGAIGIGLHRIYERHDAAAPYDARLDGAVQKLERRGNSRVGSGPARAKIWGVDV